MALEDSNVTCYQIEIIFENCTEFVYIYPTFIQIKLRNVKDDIAYYCKNKMKNIKLLLLKNKLLKNKYNFPCIRNMVKLSAS